MAITIDFDKVDTLDIKIANAINTKTEECEDFAEALINVAKSNPSVGVTANPRLYTKRIKARERNNNNKLSGEIILTQDEKDQAKTDQKLSEYEVKCWDASDKAVKEVNKGTDPALIKLLDVSTLTTWPVWSPPV